VKYILFAPIEDVMNRKQFIFSLAPLLARPFVSQAAGPKMQVYKTPTCGCCGKWVQHLRDNGFEVAVQDVPDTSPYRRKYGVPDQLASCHTGFVESYAVEGHVPAREIRRILREKPKAAGLAVPGMPAGSPGMEAPRSQAYSVLLVGVGGEVTVYEKYAAG
jgi:hypothetical protein